jgi:hypothetical protein
MVVPRLVMLTALVMGPALSDGYGLASKTDRPGLSTRSAMLVPQSTPSESTLRRALGPLRDRSLQLRRPPAQWLAKVRQDALEARWAHVDVEARGPGATGFYSEVVGTASGTQELTLNGEKVEAAVLVGNVAYYKADATILKDMGAPSAVITKIADRWISARSPDQVYSSVAAALKMTEVLDATLPSAPLTVAGTAEVGGIAEVAIRGGLPKGTGGGTGTATAWVTLGAHPKLVKTSANFGTSSGPVTTFSRWGAPVRIVAPSRAVPAASVGL